MKLNPIIRLVLIAVVPLFVVVGTYIFLSNAFYSPADPSRNEEILVEVSPGMTFRDVCSLLQKQGIIRYGRSLDILARIKGSNTRTINAGEYTLSPSMTPSDVLNALVSGKVKKRKVIVKEGVSIWEIGVLVEEAGLLTKDEFNKALTDPSLLVQAGINASSFEGYLFPETYDFSRPITPKGIIWRMLEEGEKHWPPQGNALAEKMKLGRPEILTLASIIEKESGNASEQPIISSVFHNRITQGMKLQADPTVIYGIKNFNGNLTKEDLENRENPYNTYAHFGLPPGPICNPGESAILAALSPAPTQFLFFVADGTGSHIFSSTLKEHNEAVERFQKGKKDASPGQD